MHARACIHEIYQIKKYFKADRYVACRFCVQRDFAELTVLQRMALPITRGLQAEKDHQRANNAPNKTAAGRML